LSCHDGKKGKNRERAERRIKSFSKPLSSPSFCALSLSKKKKFGELLALLESLTLLLLVFPQREHKKAPSSAPTSEVYSLSLSLVRF
jgi:hypothetical protein